MKTHAERTKEKKNKPIADHFSKKQEENKSFVRVADHRPEVVAQQKLQEMADNSSRVTQLRKIQDMATEHSQRKVTQFMKVDNNNIPQEKKAPNNEGTNSGKKKSKEETGNDKNNNNDN